MDESTPLPSADVYLIFNPLEEEQMKSFAARLARKMRQDGGVLFSLMSSYSFVGKAFEPLGCSHQLFADEDFEIITCR